MKTELRLTDTNAASDSAGRTWGLEGNLIWWLIGGLGLGITVLFLMVVAFKAKVFFSLGVAAFPVLLALGYVLTLRLGKPPGYDRDVIERLFLGDGFGPGPSSPQHPLAVKSNSIRP